MNKRKEIVWKTRQYHRIQLGDEFLSKRTTNGDKMKNWKFEQDEGSD